MDLLWEALRDAVGLIGRADPELLRIAGLSLGVSAVATGLAGLIGIPLGIALHLGPFVGRAPAALLVNPGMDMQASSACSPVSSSSMRGSCKALSSVIESGYSGISRTPSTPATRGPTAARFGQGTELHQPHAVGVAADHRARNFQRKPRLAVAADARQCVKKRVSGSLRLIPALPHPDQPAV
jgi:hypothetical protein